MNKDIFIVKNMVSYGYLRASKRVFGLTSLSYVQFLSKNIFYSTLVILEHYYFDIFFIIKTYLHSNSSNGILQHQTLTSLTPTTTSSYESSTP